MRNLPEFRENARSIYCTRIESAIQTRLSSAKAIQTPFKRLTRQWGKSDNQDSIPCAAVDAVQILTQLV